MGSEGLQPSLGDSITRRALCIYIFPFLEPLPISLPSGDILPYGPEIQASLIPSRISCILSAFPLSHKSLGCLKILGDKMEA